MKLKLKKSIKITSGYLRALLYCYDTEDFHVIDNRDFVSIDSENLIVEVESNSSQLIKDLKDILISEANYKAYQTNKFKLSEISVPSIPFLFVDAILDVNIDTFLSRVSWIANDVLCLHIRLHGNISNIDMINLVQELQPFRFESLILEFDAVNWQDTLVDLFMIEKRIISLRIYNASQNEYLEYDDKTLMFRVENLDEKYCGIVSSEYFTLSRRHYSLAKFYNSCLYRKIAIDVNGRIKNCPSMKESFGNISDTSLVEACEKPGFKKYWDINKNKIHVCKDCEFRYICTDCRAYVDDSEDILSKPLKCGYNPYAGEWNEWSRNPLKQKAIGFYGLNEIIKSN